MNSEQRTVQPEPSIEVEMLGLKISESGLESPYVWVFLVFAAAVALGGLYIWKYGVPKSKAKKEVVKSASKKIANEETKSAKTATARKPAAKKTTKKKAKK